ncbi:Myb-like DNA-binding domain, partial [Musa troglodytarum]
MREMVLETCSRIKAHHVFPRPSRLLSSWILVNQRLVDLYTLLFAMSFIYIMVHRNLHHVPGQTGRLTDLWNLRISCCPKYPWSVSLPLASLSPYMPHDLQDDKDGNGPLLAPSILK